MNTRSRQQLVLGLIGVFFIQTFFVYTDPEGRRTPPLSELAGRGQALWHRHNCQSCHQLYGFGGFLGPDLTNAAKQLTSARLESILVTGSERMPAFGMSAAEIRSVAAFLEEVDRTGVSQPKLGPALAPRDLLASLVDGAALQDVLTGAALAGRAIVAEQNCIDCHLPNRRSAYLAPDLTRITADLGAERIRVALIEGVPQKGMPRLDLASDDCLSVLAFLEFLERNGAAIRSGFERAAQRSAGSFPLPAWYEYPER